MKRLDNKERNEDEKKAHKGGIAVFLSVAVLFLVIICGTELISMKFGKTAGTISLAVIAGVMAFLLYKKEIIAFFRRK